MQKKTLLTTIKSLLFTAFIAGIIWACEDERPEINLPNPVIPTKEFKYISTLSPDTIKFKATDTITFSLRTIPYDLLNREGMTVQIADTAGAKYQYAEIHSRKLSRDSIWNIMAHIKKGVRSGDIVSLMVADKDTVMYSEPIVLYVYPDHPWSIETLRSDIAFTTGDTIALQFKTSPLNLLARDSVKLALTDSIGSVYEFAEIKSKTFNDGIWSIFAKTRKGAKTGDMISLRITERDTILYSEPIAMSVTTAQRALYTLTPDTLTFEGDLAEVMLKTQPFNLLARRDVSIAITDNSDNSYKFADIKSVSLHDSIWSIILHMTYGMENGDIIKVRVSDDDTVMFSNPIVLDKIEAPEPTHYSADIVSGDVSAFLEGGQASIRLRTAPWNMLFNDSTFTLSLVDNAGNPVDGKLKIDSKVFQPVDSCWKVGINILDQSLTDASVAARITCPDTVITTRTVNIRKVSISMRSIKVNNEILMRYDTINNTYMCRLDPTADFKSQKYTFDYDGDKLTIGDSLLVKGQQHTLNVSSPITVSVWKYDVHVDYILKLSYNYSISIISGSVSAYTNNSQATIRLKMAPWNIQPSDTAFILALADVQGNSVEQSYKIASKQFQPQDSSWVIKIRAVDRTLTDGYVSAKLTCPDTIVFSQTVNLKKVAFSMKSVKAGNGKPLNYDSSSKTYSYRCDPSEDLSKQQIMFDHDGDKLTIDDNTYQTNQYYTLDVRKPITVSVWKYDIHIDYIIHYSLYYSVSIVSNAIAGFADNNQTTISVRTVPWNILLNNNDGYSMELSDKDGNSVTDKFSIAGKTFVPADSTWSVNINVIDKNLTEYDVAVKLICANDTTLISNTVSIRKISISLTSVKTGNDLTMKYDSRLNTFYLFRPEVIDYTNQKFLFNYSGEKIVVGDRVLTDGQYNTIDVSKPVTVTVWQYGAHKDYTIMANTGLPIVRINTNGQSVTRRDTWVTGIDMTIELPDGTIDSDASKYGTISMKGRGNGTWTETNKKPYAIRLDEKAKILGMHKQKRWILLANYKDRTLLRNDAAFWLSRHTDMPYTVDGRYVELVWNGKHMGNYYLCEQARIDNHRIDIASPKLDDPENGGIYMEIDAFLDYNNSGQNGDDKIGDVGFWSEGASKRYKLPYILKDPDEDEAGNPLTKQSPTYTYLFNYVTTMEDAIYASDASDDWMNYLDIDRAIDFALIQEITMNHDSYNTWPKAGPHSAFLYKDSCGPICFGPMWDFDYHTFTLYNDGSNGNQASGENPRIKQWEILTMDNKGGGSSGGWSGGGWGGFGGGSSSGNKYYFADLAKKSPKFRERLLERWNKYKYVWRDSLPVYIDQMADSIRLSESYNIVVWAENTTKSNYKQNGDYNLSFQNAVAAMKSAFLKRWEWMDANLPKLGQ